VTEGPGGAGGQVVSMPALSLPCGVPVASQFASDPVVRASLGDGQVTAKGKFARVPVDSAPAGQHGCFVRVELLAGKKAKKGKGRSAKKRKKPTKVIGRGSATILGGDNRVMKVKLSKRGRVAVHRGGVRVRVTTIDPAGNTIQVTNVKVAKAKNKAKKKRHG
jgi:hypothetical protein